jgi:hypothetical protein
VVDGLVWDQEAAGSSPVSPTISVSVVVSTSDFHSGITGSNPVPRTRFYILLSSSGRTPDFDSGKCGSNPRGSTFINGECSLMVRAPACGAGRCLWGR